MRGAPRGPSFFGLYGSEFAFSDERVLDADRFVSASRSLSLCSRLFLILYLGASRPPSTLGRRMRCSAVLSSLATRGVKPLFNLRDPWSSAGETARRSADGLRCCSEMI